MKLLIIPDIHGRDFWKEPCKKFYKYDKVIFLGDYLDPYSQEEIFPEEARHNLIDIIEFVIHNKNKIITLIGNHDFHYLNDYYRELAVSTRYEAYNQELNKALLEMLPLQLAYQEQIGDITYLFTHAGINKKWFERNSDIIGKDFSSSSLNSLIKTNKGIATLGEIGYSRGGYCETGSILWADVSDILTKRWTNYFQVFGHTQLKKPLIMGQSEELKKYSNNELFACLDYRKAFVIDESGIKEWKNK